MSYRSASVERAPAPGRARPLANLLYWIELAVLWLEEGAMRARQRRQLAELDDRSLKDIGITRTDALREASKPFWRA